MNRPHIYEIQIEGLLPNHWSVWLEDLAIHQVSDEETVLKGKLLDQAALLGVLAKIHAMNLTIAAVIKIPEVE